MHDGPKTQMKTTGSGNSRRHHRPKQRTNKPETGRLGGLAIVSALFCRRLGIGVVLAL
jgi:hypothetical protein